MIITVAYGGYLMTNSKYNEVKSGTSWSEPTGMESKKTHSNRPKYTSSDSDEADVKVTDQCPERDCPFHLPAPAIPTKRSCSKNSDYPKATLIHAENDVVENFGASNSLFSASEKSISESETSAGDAGVTRSRRDVSPCDHDRDVMHIPHTIPRSKPKRRIARSFTRLSRPDEPDIRRLSLASDSINSSHTSEEDLVSLRVTMDRLRESGWYFENITRLQAKQVLRNKSMGAFIIRDSTDPTHLFSLSVRTPRGTTSVRIEYTNGRFRLDCEDRIRHHMPVFGCVVKLVNFYIKLGQRDCKINPCVWLESTGRRDMPVRLSQPVRREIPSLMHLCRLSVANAITDAQDSLFPNQEREMIAKLPLPNPLIRYIQDYPYPH